MLIAGPLPVVLIDDPDSVGKEAILRAARAAARRNLALYDDCSQNPGKPGL
jgi:hypothetical protein